MREAATKPDARARARADTRTRACGAETRESCYQSCRAVEKTAALRSTLKNRLDRGPWNSKGPPISGYMCRDERNREGRSSLRNEPGKFRRNEQASRALRFATRRFARAAGRRRSRKMRRAASSDTRCDRCDLVFDIVQQPSLSNGQTTPRIPSAVITSAGRPDRTGNPRLTQGR